MGGYLLKIYQSQTPVIERAIETGALMLGSDRSRGYCLEMICADFLAGADLDAPTLAVGSPLVQGALSSGLSARHLDMPSLRLKR